MLEREPLEGLAADGQLHVYRHDGFWQCADTVRDVELLRGLWDARRGALARLGRPPRRRLAFTRAAGAGDRVEALLREALP